MALLPVTSIARAQSAAASPSSDEPKRHFDEGLRLFKEHSYEAALAEFQESYRRGQRPAALRNVAQTLRELHRNPEAFEAFETLQATHGSELSESDKRDIGAALRDLAQVTATLGVTVSESGANVSLDGKPLGISPVARRARVATGMHKVRAEKLGFDPVDIEVQLVGGQDGSVDLKMFAERRVGRLAVREKSGVAIRVLVDGKDVGSAPWDGVLAPGVHKIEGRAPGYSAVAQTVEIGNKTTTEVVLDRSDANAVAAVVPVVAQVAATPVAPAAVPPATTTAAATGAPPPPAAKPVEPLKPADSSSSGSDLYTGLYGNFSLLAQFGVGGTSGLYDACVAKQSCDHTTPIGGGLSLRIGYNFDIIGIEVAGMFMSEYRSETMNATGTDALSRPNPTAPVGPSSDTKRNENLYLVGYHAFLGAGPRITSKGQAARFTFAVTPGVAFRNYVMGRTVDLSLPILPPTVYTDSAHDNAFGMLLDGGVMFGSTPGTKLTIGLVAWIDFASNVRTAGGSDITGNIPGVPGVPITRPMYPVTNATNFYIGPSIGFNFGH